VKEGAENYIAALRFELLISLPARLPFWHVGGRHIGGGSRWSVAIQTAETERQEETCRQQACRGRLSIGSIASAREQTARRIQVHIFGWNPPTPHPSVLRSTRRITAHLKHLMHAVRPHCDDARLALDCERPVQGGDTDHDLAPRPIMLGHNACAHVLQAIVLGPTAAAGSRACRHCSMAPTFVVLLCRYKFEDRQVVDYVREATRKNIWYYRDRMSVPRGPCSLPVLRECWVSRCALGWGRVVRLGSGSKVRVRQVWVRIKYWGQGSR